MAFSMFRHSAQLEGAVIDPPVEFFDDFIEGRSYTVANETVASAQGKFSELADMGDWLVTVVDTGGGTESIVISDDEPGGVVTLTTSSALNDSLECQLNGEAWKVAADKDIYFKCRLKLADADSTDWFVGLATTDTDVIGTATEMIGFGSGATLEGGATGDIYFGSGDGMTAAIDDSTNGGSWSDSGDDGADDTFFTVAFRVVSNGQIKFFVNNDYVGSVSSSGDIPDSDAVTLTMAVRADGAAQHTMEVDYIYCGQER